MPKPIIPALADLSQDIAGKIPVGLVQAWMESARDAAEHERLLAPFARTGTIVCSDSAGLSKMSKGRPLVEVMKLVSEPKEIIHAHGKAVGGTAVGMWVADNTQMFYDDAVPVETVVCQMIAAQRVMQTCAVKVGIGIHRGMVYEIGGGLYGADADEIEGFTEEETKGGEVAVSREVREMIGAHLPSKEERAGKFVLNHEACPVEANVSDDVYYPSPFPRAFHDAIRTLDATNMADVDRVHAAYAQNSSIILVRVFHEEESFLLDTFVSRTAANALLYRVSHEQGVKVIESNGAVAIMEVKDPSVAVRFAKAVMAVLQENGFTANVGACTGEVLLFDFGNGTWNVAGTPVNISSKLAEDTPDRNAFFFEESIAEAARAQGFTTPFEIEKSGVMITGVK